MAGMTLNEYENSKLRKLLRSFHQAFRINGVFKVKFGEREMQDSDNNSVIDVYLTPQDDTAIAQNLDIQSRHMQFLEGMVPSTISGMQYLVRVDDSGPDLEIEVLDVISPVSS